MKNPVLLLNKLENKHFLGAWIVFHLGILVFFLITFVSNPGKIGVDADLFNMLPKPIEEEALKVADEKVTEATGQNVFILASDEDFGKARAAAVSVYDRLVSSPNFNSVALYSDMGSLSDVTDFIYKYRWNMLDDEAIDQINSPGGAEIFSQNALSQAYGAFTMFPLDNLDKDPFMLCERNLGNYLDSIMNSGIAMSVKDGVLASQHDGRWYVMIRGILSKQGAALASDDNGISEIYSICTPLETDGTRFVYSGTPFHSNESSNSASKEITVITTVSMIVVILMLLIIFRTPKPIVYSVGAIVVSILTAVLSTLAVFRQMHILTLVFGTSLIGSCIDYSLHFFTNWMGNRDLKSGRELRNFLLPGYMMAIVSTLICFGILLFAPFNLLKQMALFSMAGLMSTFLTAVAVFPYIPLPPEEKRTIKLVSMMKRSPRYNSRLVGRIVITAVFVVSIGTILICHKNVRIENNVTKLYKMEGRLLSDEIEAGTILQYNPTGWFIIKGDTEEQVLSAEEKLIKEFRNMESGKGVGFLGTSLFIPSEAHQRKSRAAAEKLLALADWQLEALGYGPDEAAALRADFAASSDDFISISGGSVPQFLLDSISGAWLGELEGSFYSVVLPSRINDAADYRNLADSMGSVWFVNKMSDMSGDLDKLTVMILEFFAVAYILMFVVLKFFYSWKQSFKIISIPLLIVLVTTAVFAVAKINLEFFSVTGLILVFGLGLDYIIYMMENENHKDERDNLIEPFAIMLSFLTTVLSFGALALSSFTPVHLIGLSIFIGLTTAYVSSFFYDRSL